MHLLQFGCLENVDISEVCQSDLLSPQYCLLSSWRWLYADGLPVAVAGLSFSDHILLRLLCPVGSHGSFYDHIRIYFDLDIDVLLG